MTARLRRHALGLAITVLLTGVPVAVGTAAPPTAADVSAAAPATAADVAADPRVRVAAVPDPAGPPMLTDARARHTAVACFGDVGDAGAPGGPGAQAPKPVLLVPGTGLTAEENWAPTYRPALRALGHAVCQVDLPHHATRDVQLSAEYVATAIHDVHAAARREVAVVGLSQGALLPRAALRLWPELADEVDDVVGVAGVYDVGSTAVTERCARACVPALQQLRRRALLLRALGARPLPAGPSYTNVGTAADTTATPQPDANEQPGSTSVLVQDVCPGREPGPHAHGWLVGDAVAFALVLDALGHRGPGSAGRVPATTCEEQYYEGFDAEAWEDRQPLISARLVDPVTTEPPVRCYLRADCRDADARGRLLRSVRVARVGRIVVWRGHATGRGALRFEYGRRTVVRRVGAPGPVEVRLRASRRAASLTVRTRPTYFSAWGREARHRVPGRAR